MKNRRASQKGANPSARLQIVYRGIDQLEPDLANPRRRHSKKQVRQIADSIRVFGFNVPILIVPDSLTETLHQVEHGLRSDAFNLNKLPRADGLRSKPGARAEASER